MISEPLSSGLWQKALRKYPGRALRKKFHILKFNYIPMLKSPTAPGLIQMPGLISFSPDWIFLAFCQQP
jgi:hypothetical protein